MVHSHESKDYTGILDGGAPALAFTTKSPEEEDLVQAIQRRFTEAKEDKDPRQEAWEFNRLYERGDQLIARDRYSNEVVRIRFSEESERFLSRENLLRPTSRALVGKLSRTIPTFDAIPASEDDSDLRAAQVHTGLLEYARRKEQLDVKWVQGCRTLTWAGNNWFQLFWDKRAGQEKSFCRECNYQDEPQFVNQPCPQCAMQIQSAEQEKMAMGAMQIEDVGQEPQQPPMLVRTYEGDFGVRKLDVRDCYPEPGPVQPDQLRWFIVKRPVALSDLRGDFPDRGRYVNAEEGIYLERMVNYYGASSSTNTVTRYLKDHVYLYEYHEMPSDLYKEGRLIYMANDIILNPENMDHPHTKLLGRLPFYQQWFQREDGELWGTSYINDAWTIQRERNKLLTQLRAHRDLTNRPWLLKPQRSRLGVDEIDDVPGRILEYNQMAGKPSWLELPQIPQYTYAELERMATAIANQATVTEQEMGHSPADQSGRHAALVEAQSSESVRPILIESYAEWSALHRGILLVCDAHYTDDRTWTIKGKDRILTFTWRDANLRPGFDLEMSLQDGLSKNPALRLDQAKALQAELQYFTDQRTGMLDRRYFAKVAGLTDPGVAPDIAMKERIYFSQIPDKLEQGGQHQMMPWDDARIAVEELVGWLRGQGRTATPTLVQAVGQVYLQYISVLPLTPLDMDIYPIGAGGPPVQQAPGAQQGGQGGSFGPGATAQPGGVAQEAAQITQQSDAQAEGAARQQENHEG